VKRRYRADEVRAVNGRGGDGGLDIEILTADGRLIILQLKYFPEGFSGGFAKSRRPQIKDSFNTAQERQPDEWTLVVPTVLTDTESAFVSGLGGDVSDGRGPKITVVDRDELDDWLADDPTLDKYFQRDPTTTLAEFARDFGQEKAAFLGGTEDLASRISNLGGVTDTLDPDWTLDFARTGDGVQMAVRPQHPKAVETNKPNPRIGGTILRIDRRADRGGERPPSRTGLRRLQCGPHPENRRRQDRRQRPSISRGGAPARRHRSAAGAKRNAGRGKAARNADLWRRRRRHGDETDELWPPRSNRIPAIHRAVD
jgi:hypothetical protein